MPQPTNTSDLGRGWYASANDDGSFTIRNPEKGQRIDLTAASAAKFCSLYRQAELDAREAAEADARA